jgi:hypothetical protein
VFCDLSGSTALGVDTAHEAEPGEVLIGADTRRLVRDATRVAAVEFDAKGEGDVSAFRLLDVDLHAPALARHLDAPLIGRSREVSLLRQAHERALQEQTCYLLAAATLTPRSTPPTG